MLHRHVYFWPEAAATISQIGRIRSVTSVEAAAEELFTWKGKRKKWRVAVETSIGAMEGCNIASDVRKALPAAATKARKHVRHRD